MSGKERRCLTVRIWLVLHLGTTWSEKSKWVRSQLNRYRENDKGGVKKRFDSWTDRSIGRYTNTHSPVIYETNEKKHQTNEGNMSLTSRLEQKF